METVQWKVEGMDCSNCALTIHKYLQKEGMKNVKVNFATGDVLFETNDHNNQDELVIGIKELGYRVSNSKLHPANDRTSSFLTTHLQRFLFCLPFTRVIKLVPGG